MKRLFILLLICYSFVAKSQTPRHVIDSLRLQMTGCKDDTCRATLTKQIAFTYYNVPDFDSMMQCGMQLLSLADSIKYKKGIADGYNAIGVAFNMKNDDNSALATFLLALDVRKEIHDSAGIGSTLCNIAIISARHHHYRDALKTYKAAKEMSEKANDKPVLANVLYDMGLLYASKRKYSLALEKYYLPALTMYTETGDKQGMTAVYYSCALRYLARKEYNNAEEFANKGLALAKETDNSEMTDEFNALLEKIEKHL